VYFQVKARDAMSTPPHSLRYRRLWDYSAPCWGLDVLPVKPWPADVHPVVEVFWAEDEIKPAGTLRRDVHFTKVQQVIRENAEVDVRVNQKEWGTVTLEDVRIEKRQLEDPQTGKEKPVSCLAVRLRHPEGKPFLVRLPTAWRPRPAEEHRFYTQAGKYTALFWPVTADDFSRSLQSLELISLEGFRETAQNLRNHAILELGEPNDGWRPEGQ
jgi:hypothetical protein